jgi:hypothetical protein
MAYTAGSQPTCPHARTYIQIAEQMIFNKITAATTPEQFTAAEEILLQLCQRLEAQVDMFHYPAATGDHWCVRDVYDHAVLALKGLAAMHQQAVPEPPRQQVVTVEGVVIEAEERLRTSSQETYLGTDDSTPDNGTAR